MQTFYTTLRRIGGSRLGGRLAPIAPLNWLYHSLIGWCTAQAKYVMIDGHKLFLDPHDYCGLLMSGASYEPLVTALMKRVVKPGEVVVDLGALVGYYTLLLARLVGPEGRVFAFEPEPRAFALLQKNVAENGYENVTLIPKAVSDQASSVAFRRTRSGVGGVMALGSTAQAGGGHIQVETVTLDEVFEGFERPIAFMKLDIEGCEYAALQGAQAVLRANPQMAMVAEVNPAALRACEVEPRAYLQRLGELGFHLRHIEGELAPVEDPDALLRRLTGSITANLFCSAAAAPAGRGTE